MVVTDGYQLDFSVFRIVRASLYLVMQAKFPKKGKTENYFFSRIEVKESSFIIENNSSLTSQCQ